MGVGANARRVPVSDWRAASALRNRGARLDTSRPAVLGHDGVCRVDEIVAVTGRVEAETIETETVFERQPVGGGPGPLLRGGGQPPHAERFTRVGVDVGAALAEDW